MQTQVSSFQQYRAGTGVDRIAGVEALISELHTATPVYSIHASLLFPTATAYRHPSPLAFFPLLHPGHVITKELMLPCAHAPAFAPYPAGTATGRA